MITGVWNERLRELRRHGNGFSYTRIAEIIGVSRPNVSNKFSTLIEQFPDAIREETGDDPRKKKITIDYDALLQDGGAATERPSFLSERTFDVILNAIGDFDKLEFRGIDWDEQYQRGGVEVLLFDTGQNLPKQRRIFRFDNCILLTPDPEREDLGARIQRSLTHR